LEGSKKYSKSEIVVRNKVASAYRLTELFGWTEGIYNHITARLPENPDAFLINPYGLTYDEITASSLVKYSVKGGLLDPGSTACGVNDAGFNLHSSIYSARPDIKSMVHLHPPATIAVSCMKQGLLPLGNEAMQLGPISYHDFEGVVNDPAEKARFIKDLGPTNKVMMLRNHGFIALGESLEEAALFAWMTIVACESQVKAMAAGFENLILPTPEAEKKAWETMNHGGGGVNMLSSKDKPIEWGIGELEWEGWMRRLDSLGLKTGQIYKLRPYN